MGEIWKTVPGFSRYDASTFGRVRSTNYKRSGKIQILKPALSSDGYLKTVFLNDDGRYRPRPIHKIIAITFLDDVNGLEVNHINGIKTDNSVNNLEFVTRSENIKHAFNNGLMSAKRGSKNGMSKLSESDVLEIRKYRSLFKGRYYDRKMLAEKYGVSVYHIKDIVSKRRDIWPHV